MHILKVIHGYPPKYNAGSEVYSQSICNQLAKSHKVSIFTREQNIFASDFSIREEADGSLTKYFINLPREKDGYRHSQLDSAFAQLLDRVKPDVAHIGHLNHLSTGIIDKLNEKKIPIIFTLHDFWLMCPRGQFLQTNFANPNFYQLCSFQENRKCTENCYRAYFSGQESDYERDVEYWTQWIQTRMEETKRLCKKIQLFLAPSRYLQSRFIEEFKLPQEKIVYLDYGFPLEYLQPVEKQNEEFTFSYIGTHIPAKGVSLLIKAFVRLKGKAKLKIWGRNNGQGTASLQALAKGLSSSMAEKIEWMGEYANCDIAHKVFAATDAIVVPSIWGENSPLVIHEAQACHTPVITANYGGMKEYVHHKVNGLLFAHRNWKSLAEQMQYALDHPGEMKNFGKKGYLFSDDGQVPSIQNHCTALEKFYQNVVKDK
ncbi:glycosyltransferase [Candidatus Uabimicrobium sp. HlEnr_7]|uniref:glycosyltransferase n=1 Tax=Candidatus Uabimicrobium helgolandensis TaxID=3095367 RepID=UPI0035572815